jgi:hypothetical protein
MKKIILLILIIYSYSQTRYQFSQYNYADNGGRCLNPSIETYYKTHDCIPFVNPHSVIHAKYSCNSTHSVIEDRCTEKTCDRCVTKNTYKNGCEDRSTFRGCTDKLPSFKDHFYIKMFVGKDDCEGDYSIVAVQKNKCIKNSEGKFLKFFCDKDNLINAEFFELSRCNVGGMIIGKMETGCQRSREISYEIGPDCGNKEFKRFGNSKIDFIKTDLTIKRIFNITKLLK